jgi:hypothetical protein
MGGMRDDNIFMTLPRKIVEPAMGKVGEWATKKEKYALGRMAFFTDK